VGGAIGLDGGLAVAPGIFSVPVLPPLDSILAVSPLAVGSIFIVSPLVKEMSIFDVSSDGTAPIRLVSDVPPPPNFEVSPLVGAAMRMVSRLASGESVGFGGSVIRTVSRFGDDWGGC
jgi:hypothetical protein